MCSHMTRTHAAFLAFAEQKERLSLSNHDGGGTACSEAVEAIEAVQPAFLCPWLVALIAIYV